MRVGFLGLGSMGKPMATNLVKAGHKICVWNRSPGPVVELTKLGADAAATPRQAAEGADVMICMLADDAAVEEVIVAGGVIDALKPGSIDINMATVSVALSSALEKLHVERRIRYIAAPVLGRVNIAEAGLLNILAAGDPAALKEVEPLFDALGQKTWHFGERPEQANVVKLAINFMIASAIGTMSEAAALVEGYGVSKAKLLELASSTVLAAPVYKVYGEAIAKNQFEPVGFKLALGLKDVRLALEAGEHANVPQPVAGVIRDAHLDGLAHQDGNLDWGALSRSWARRAEQL